MQRLLGWVLRWPRWSLLAATAVLLIAAAELVDFSSGRARHTIDPGLDALLPRHAPELDLLERARARFGSDDVVLIAWLGEGLFTPAKLAELKRFARALERRPEVERVDSLASALAMEVNDDGTEIQPFLRTLPADQAAADALRARALGDPLLAGRSVARDGRGVLFVVGLNHALDSDTLTRVVGDLTQASRQAAGDLHSVVTGPLAVRLEIARVLLRDLYRIMPLAIAVTLVVAGLAFRSLRGAVVPLLANGVALVVTLALYTATGHTLNFVTVMLPPVVYVVGFAYAVHVVSGFDHALALSADRAQAIRSALAEVGLPLTLTALTTAIGFASLAWSEIRAIREFGLFATAGSLIAWLAALWIVPALLMILPLGRRLRQVEVNVERVAPVLARFALARRRALLLGGVVIAGLSLVAASRTQTSTDYLANFPLDSAVRRDFNTVSAAFGGAVPLAVIIESDIPQVFKEPAQLATVVGLQQWLASQPEIGGVYSLADYMRLLFRALAPEDAAQSDLPRTAALTDHLVLFGGGDELARFVDARFSTTVLYLTTNAVSSANLNALRVRIEAELARLPPHLRGYVTGSSSLVARTVDDVARGQVLSLGSALLTIYVVLVILFGSLRVAALALLPNSLPLMIYFGFLGASGITLNLTTSLVASVVLGIAVDETIHFLSQFNQAARRTANEALGVERALAIVLRPACFTTLCLGAGFLAMTAGELRYQVEFGWLAAATLFTSLGLYVTLTPALSGRLRVVTLWEVLTLDLGAAPQLTIPLFKGLSAREARIAALMGHLETYADGTRLMSVGEPGDAMWVIIDGECLAWIEADGVRKELRRMQRGAMIGEVGLFEGQRTANVDCVDQVRALRLSEQSLERLRERYPRIGTRIYHNLAEALARRLAELTAQFSAAGQ